MANFRILDIFLDIKKYKYFLIVYMSIFLLISLSLPNLIQPTYKTSSTIIISECRDPNPLSVTNLGICPELFIISEILKSETHLRRFINILKSEKFIKLNTIQKFINDKNEQNITDIIKAQHLRIDEFSSRGLIQISFLANSPDEASIITNKFTDFSLQEVNNREVAFLKESALNLRNNPLNKKNNIRELIANEIYEKYEQVSIMESTKPKIEILDYSYPPSSRFSPSSRLIFFQVNLLGVGIILFIYFLSKYIPFLSARR